MQIRIPDNTLVQLQYNKIRVNKKFFSGLTKDTLLLTFTSFFADVSTEMLYPILPIFLTQTLGASVGIVGLIEGVATATQNIVQGFSGYLSDRFKKRKQVALIGYLTAAISKPLMGIGAIWQTVFAGRFLDRFGTGTRSAPRDALIASSANPENRGKAFGLEGIGDNAGAFLGPILAILLLFYFQIPIRSIFYLAFIPGLLSVCMILFVKERHTPTTLHRAITFSLKNFSSSYWKYIFVVALIGMGTVSTSFFILRAKNAGIPFPITILVYAFFNLAAALISYPAGTLSDKIGRKKIMFFSLLIFIISYVGFAVSNNLLLLGGLLIAYGAYQGIFRAVGKAYATDLVVPELRASGIGWYSTTVGLTGLLASIIGGQLWTVFGPMATFLYGSVCAVTGIIALIFLL